MKRYQLIGGLTLVAVAIAVVLIASGGSNASNSRPYGTAGQARAGGHTTIQVRGSSLGRLLADGRGRIAYLFEADKPNVSKLSRAGLAIWPPVHATGRPQATNGALAAKVGTITGVDGKPQLTYARHPLYYYVGDAKPGQTNGQGLNQFGAKWYVLAPSGHKIDDD
jgi:predicted lipoprotein with Yx(FWY)xxD motif